MKIHFLFVGTLACSLFGCGGAAVPESQLVGAKSSVSAAQAVGAEQEPKAALHLKLARDEIEMAETLINEGDNEQAREALDRARLDADLSLSLTREATTRLEAQKALEKVDTLNNREGSRT
jgi:hypothetical protein